MGRPGMNQGTTGGGGIGGSGIGQGNYIIMFIRNSLFAVTYEIRY